MTEILTFNDIQPLLVFGLVSLSFVSSFITVSLGVGGGLLLLAFMANIFPASALIPVHGVIQLGSNFLRLSIMVKYVQWQHFWLFLVGTVIGVTLGGSVVVTLDPAIIQMCIGLFVVYSLIKTPPRWLSKLPILTGMFSSFLTMFFGATGVFVANYVKSLQLPRKQYVAMHALFMATQHFLKAVVFGFLGFNFQPWILFIILMMLSGFIGTLVGRYVLFKMNENLFANLLNIILFLLAVRLIWFGLKSGVFSI